ncbi:MAG TPA: uracil-DNA glycosylase family protein [Gaiellales bacterium]|jgi:uracil-DNA glycosylase|nr:uracil-DNA glycosylase family protein [Gaiellales bacterium]
MDERTAIRSVARLHRELAPCRRCVAAGIRVESMPVFSRLRRADAILVGQAPGAQEAVDGRPFIGPAGRRLRQWLEPAGLGTEEAFYGRLYIAAVAKCFPGKKRGGGDLRPSPAMVRTCLPWLERELALVEAPVVVAVGTLALNALAPDATLDDAVGAELALADGRPLYALPHPSGANPWPHLPGNGPKLERALRMITEALGRA